ncbi:alpha/beta fold hydrolase [Duganella callida]|uniref:Alpha/beta hydrolase n=1 Tax=Duganella callida TaxID=2561932 RepID=A0A4Y9S7J5_9BURK|nr:alpha/beta hydrolase [Duganella callida]TFW17495.1 alpha/beta hydrolase [Duganella callida]
MQPHVVFIHGALNDHTVWRAQSRHFAQHGYRVLTPDLPAHGAAPGPALGSVAAMADWLLAQLDAAQIGQAALVGHSLGALIALEAAARAPQRIGHLALLGVAYPMKVAETLLATARSDEPRAIDMVAKWSHTPGHERADELRQLMLRLSRQQSGRHLLHTDLAACNAYDRGEAAAGGVHCPTLFIFGASDVMTPPKAARTLTAALPHARSVTVQAGHAMMVEQPDAINDALLKFCLPEH